MTASDVYAFIGTLLDSLELGFCLFDAEDRTLLWNDTFLRFFPEHAGHVHAGEPYRENLRRFYAARLAGEELRSLDRYVEEGIARHRAQARPFVFLHLGRRLRVASLPAPDGCRARIWRQLDEEAPGRPHNAGWDTFPIDLLDHIADGATVLDQHDRIIATNDEFRALYDVPAGVAVIGSTLEDVVGAAWARVPQPERRTDGFVRDALHFAGAPFEVALPGGRWRRVIARRSAAGIGYFTHADITELKRQQADLKRALGELSAIAATDVLTGLANRRHFDEVLAAEWRRCAEAGTPAAVMVMDLDHFKRVNDCFGHAAGDECLRWVASAVRTAVTRSSDLAARHGGEEFTLLLPNATAEEAVAVAQSIRRVLRTEPWVRIHPDLAPLTVSVGICAVADVRAVAHAEAMRQADEALYRAKNAGRDRIEVQRA
ncbi:diguanylate cyclase [Xanthobacter autotrophicus DSM 431]|uniref:sensor domain-containing diguanylate cyclase n=1 Tax=Xanthobacter nonsaccharivorans TaxID=3119912 RepID=UPI003726C019